MWWLGDNFDRLSIALSRVFGWVALERSLACPTLGPSPAEDRRSTTPQRSEASGGRTIWSQLGWQMVHCRASSCEERTCRLNVVRGPSVLFSNLLDRVARVLDRLASVADRLTAGFDCVADGLADIGRGQGDREGAREKGNGEFLPLQTAPVVDDVA